MDFALGFSVVMIMGSPVGYPLEDSIIMFLGLALENYFGNSIGSLICSSFHLELGTLIGILMGSLLGN